MLSFSTKRALTRALFVVLSTKQAARPRIDTAYWPGLCHEAISISLSRHAHLCRTNAATSATISLNWFPFTSAENFLSPVSIFRIFSGVVLGMMFGLVFAQSDAPPQAIIATFEGQVFNGDNLDPLLTTFFFENGKKLRGTYVVEAEEGMDSGELFDCRLEGTYTVLCAWKDSHGTGIARMLFSADYRSFNGYWGQSGETTVFPLNGVRKDSAN